MKTIIIFGAITVGVLILAVVFRPVPKNQQSAAVDSSFLEVDGVNYDFGTVSMAKGEVSHEFKIKNTSGEKLEIKKTYTSCMCTTAWFMKDEVQKGPFGMQGHGYVPPVNESLESGEEAVVKVIFDPAAHGPAGVGPISRAVYIEGKNGRLAELMFTANVIP